MKQIQFLNDREASEWVFNQTEAFADRIAAFIHWTVESAPYNEEPNSLQRIGSQYPFDLLYFKLTVVEVIAKHLSYSLIVPLPAHAWVNPVNFPVVDLNENSSFVQSGLAQEFLDSIRRKSSPSGSQFDVQCAYAIFKFVIDEQKQPAEGGWRHVEDKFALFAQVKGHIVPSHRHLRDEGKLFAYHAEQAAIARERETGVLVK